MKIITTVHFESVPVLPLWCLQSLSSSPWPGLRQGYLLGFPVMVSQCNAWV